MWSRCDVVAHPFFHNGVLTRRVEAPLFCAYLPEHPLPFWKNNCILIPQKTRKRWKNRITTLFGIRYPVVAGGMVRCSGWRLAAAVSEAGGAGLIGSGSMTPRTAARAHPQMPCGHLPAVRRQRAAGLPLCAPADGRHHGRARPGRLHLGGQPRDLDRTSARRRLPRGARGVEFEIRAQSREAVAVVGRGIRGRGSQRP